MNNLNFDDAMYLFVAVMSRIESSCECAEMLREMLEKDKSRLVFVSLQAEKHIDWLDQGLRMLRKINKLESLTASSNRNKETIKSMKRQAVEAKEILFTLKHPSITGK